MSEQRKVFWFAVTIFALCWAGVAKVHAAPACYPDLVYPAKLAVEPIEDTKYTNVAVWTCQTSTGYVNELWAFSQTELDDFIPSLLRGVFDETEARNRCSAQCVDITDVQLDAKMKAFAADKVATAKVTSSGTALTRPVYAINPDGSRGALVSGARVAIGAPCWLSRRIGTTNYYSVVGNPNIATADPNDYLGNVAAVCTATFPLGVNQ